MLRHCYLRRCRYLTNRRIRQLHYSWSSNTHHTASPVAWCRNDSRYATREATLWKSFKRPRVEDFRYDRTKFGIPHVIQCHVGMDNTYSASHLWIRKPCSRPNPIPFPCALPVSMYILCYHRKLFCQIPRECYAHRRIHIIANAVPLRSQLAIEQHFRLLAGHFICIPKHLRSTRIRTNEQYGSRVGRRRT